MRSPGEGSLTQRPDGRWQASLQVDGRRRVVYGKTRREAEQKLQELRRQVAQTGGNLPHPGRRTVSDLLDQWLQTAVLRPRTRAGYEWVCGHIRQHIGHIRLARLDPAHLQRLYAQLPGKRLPAMAHTVLHRALAVAVMWGWLPYNPADRVIKPKYTPERKEVWTPEQLATFLEGTKTHWLSPLFVLLATTGCRLSELLGLKWADIEGDTLTIRRSLHYVRGRFVQSPPKTRSGERVITLPEAGVAALRRQRAQQAEWRLRAGSHWQDLDLVFTNQAGGYLRPSTVQRAMQRFVQQLGLPPTTPHGLRHLHASLLLSKGLPLTDVSARLGHATSSVTASVYSHAIPGRDIEAARVMDRILKGGGHAT